ncbi:uncharacterized protein LOC112691040 isoform X2 [Sipha flava]|nr:uncharacterized protein LOC112691040 isoform X2 [Sipha flava]
MKTTKLQSQLKIQAAFLTKVGATLGHYLWKITQVPDIVNIILREDKLTKLSEIMVNVLTSFIDTYQSKIPTTDTEETMFILSIIGLVANLSTEDRGRQFFSQNNIGKNVIKLIMTIVTHTSSSSGNQWKKISYVALYNVSIFSNGSSGFMIDAGLVKALNDDIEDRNNTMTGPDQRCFALKLLHSLLRNVCTKTTYNIMKNNVRLSSLVKLTSAVDTEIKTIAQIILEDFRKANEKFETKIIMS